MPQNTKTTPSTKMFRSASPIAENPFEQAMEEEMIRNDVVLFDESNLPEDDINEKNVVTDKVQDDSDDAIGEE